MSDTTETTSTLQGEASKVEQIASLFLEPNEPIKKEEENKNEQKNDVQEQEGEGEGEGEEREGVDGDDENTEKDTNEEEEVTWGKILGIDDQHLVLDEEGNFTGIKTKVNGKVENVDLPTLLKGYQDNKSNTVKSKKLAEERNLLVTEKTNILNEYQEKIKAADALVKYLENTTLKEYQNIDWDRFKAENPAEYAAAVIDYQLKASELEKVKEAINMVNNEETVKFQKEATERERQFVASQVEKAVEDNPEWADKKIFKSALENMAMFLNEKYGFSIQEFAEVKDARILKLIKDAQKYHDGVKVAEKKIPKNVAKFQKTISRQSKPETKLQKLINSAKTSTGRAQKSAQVDAVTELIFGKNQ